MQNGNPGCRFLCLLPLPVGEGWGKGIQASPCIILPVLETTKTKITEQKRKYLYCPELITLNLMQLLL